MYVNKYLLEYFNSKDVACVKIGCYGRVSVC